MAQLYVAVTLVVRSGMEEAFRAFESRALAIAKEHGGEVVVLLRLAERAEATVPYEFHLLRFPDQGAFASFRSDPRTSALQVERERVIEATQIVTGTEFSLPESAR